MREGERTIYFDHAATTPLDGEVFEKCARIIRKISETPIRRIRSAVRLCARLMPRGTAWPNSSVQSPTKFISRRAAPKATIGRYSGPPMRRGKREKRASSSLRSSTTPRSLRRSVWKRGLLRRLSARQRARRSGNGGFARSAYARDGAGGGDGGEQRDGRRPAL